MNDLPTHETCPLPTATDIIDMYLAHLQPQGVQLVPGSYGRVTANASLANTRLEGVCPLTVLALEHIPLTDLLASNGVKLHSSKVERVVHRVYDTDIWFTGGVITGFDSKPEQTLEEKCCDHPGNETWVRGVTVGHQVRVWLETGERPA